MLETRNEIDKQLDDFKTLLAPIKEEQARIDEATKDLELDQAVVAPTKEGPDFSFSSEVKKDEAELDKMNKKEDANIENIMNQMEMQNKKQRELAEAEKEKLRK